MKTSEVVSPQLSIKKCREILGKVAEKMTDLEIEDLRNIFIVISDLAINSYLEKKGRKSKNEQ